MLPARPAVGSRITSAVRASHGRLTPKFIRALPVDRVAVAVRRRADQGDRQTAIRIGESLVWAVPRSGKARRFLIRALLTSPASAEDVIRASSEAEIMITLWEDEAVRNCYVDVLIARHALGGDASGIDAIVAAFAGVRPAARANAVRRYFVHLVSSGEKLRARDLSRSIASVVDDEPYWAMAHFFALRADDPDAAMDIERVSSQRSWWTDEFGVRRANERLMHQGRYGEAAEALATLRPTRSGPYSASYVRSLESIGDSQGVLTYLDGTVHNLGLVEETVARIDALMLLGRLDEADEQLSAVSSQLLSDMRVFRRARDLDRERGDVSNEVLLEQLQHHEHDLNVVTAEVELLMRMYFELDAIDEVERIWASPAMRWRAGVLGTYSMVLTEYVRRRFDRAELLIDKLRGTIRHWEAESIRARIMFERGDDAAALAHRSQYGRHDGEIDEIVYHALLHENRLDEAFRLYVSPKDSRRHRSTFGERAESIEDLPFVEERAIVTQNGPGDEFLLASIYPLLQERSDRLVVTCDPRLRSLMVRSFPGIEFVPVERLRSRAHPGFLATGTEPRSRSAFWDLLTEDAFDRVSRADRVRLGRSLPYLSLLRDSPSPRFLEIEPDRDVAMNGSRPERRVGLVWRSEFNSAMRSFHYLSPEDLAPLLDVDANFVCLQHDATPEERYHLDRLARNPVTYLDHVDLRNDFDTTAAHLVHLEAVVGIGTTISELAAALGVRTYLLQPTRFGAWRSRDENGSDYWHASARVIVASDPSRSTEVVDLVASALSCLLDRATSDDARHGRVDGAVTRRG